MCSGEHGPTGSLRPVVENPKTRGAAADRIQSWLEESVRARQRVLVGFDFSFGLPSVAYAALGFPAGWRAYWEHLARAITDDERNANNRFEVARALNQRAAIGGGPFWGAPPSAAGRDLTATKPRNERALPELRAVEIALRATGKRPFSTWQLFGNGSVVSQSLVGIPVLHRLRFDAPFRDCSRVWPFEDDWKNERARPWILHGEIWPGAIDIDPSLHPVRDAAQVIGLVAWAAGEDRAGRLAAHLDAFRASPAREAAARSEGWVVGVG